MAKQKPGTIPSSLAAFQKFFNPATARSSGQATTKLFVAEDQLIVFAAYVEEMFPGVIPNPKLGNTLAQNGETQQVVLAVYHGKPGNNLQIYASGKGSASGTMADITWPIPEKQYNVLAKKFGQPLLGVKVPATAVAEKPATRRKPGTRKPKVEETKDADRVL